MLEKCVALAYTGAVETARHMNLKLIGAALLGQAGCPAFAAEVACPLSRWRIDLAGYFDTPDHLKWGDPAAPLAAALAHRPAGPLTVAMECKQCRADFVRDGGSLDRLVQRRAHLAADARELEERIIRSAEPHLRGRGAMLFAELEVWNFAASGSPTYRAIQRELRSIDERIHGQTKFWMMARYALADVLLIVAPRGLIAAAEAPPGWGLVEAPGGMLRGAALGESLAAPVSEISVTIAASRPSPPQRRARLLRNIAAAATRQAWRGVIMDRRDPRENGEAGQAPADSPTA